MDVTIVVRSIDSSFYLVIIVQAMLGRKVTPKVRVRCDIDLATVILLHIDSGIVRV